jgi:hypothetical protein
MRHAFLLVLVVGIAACGAYRFPSGTPASSGSVSGQVLAVPCSPVVNPQTLCKGRPVPGLEIDFTAGNRHAVVTKTDSKGNYAVQLDAGTWTVTIRNMRVISGPPTVTVDAGATLVANYIVDSGIRVPPPPAQGAQTT